MSDKDKKQVLFMQAHRELLSIGEQPEVRPETQGLYQLLASQGFEPASLDDPVTSDHLENVQVLVLGAPHNRLNDGEVETIQRFVEEGGGLLLVTDSDAMINPVVELNQLAQKAGLEFREYLNYPPTWLQVFSSHYITANVDRVKVQHVAHIVCSDGARKLAFTKATHSVVVACGALGRGRVVAVGDVGLFTTDSLELKGNETLAVGAFRWLASQNAIDIQEVVVPEVVKWGQSETVMLKLYNGQAETRPQIECILESDVDAQISEPAAKKRSIPSGKTTQMQWTVTPKILGDQKLRLSIHIDGQPSLYFDRLLPDMCCIAPGYLTLQIHKEDQLRTEFETGDYFEVDGSLHWPAGLELPPHQLNLESDKGIIQRGHQPGEGVSRWQLQATTPGTRTLTLKVEETGQSLPATVTVRSSIQDQLAELRAAYIYPLDAEITERLRMVDPRLSDKAVQDRPFKVLPPEEYIQKVYDAEAAVWLREVLAAARREQWYNLDLLNEVLTYFAPAYLPGKGSFVPYDPALASHLTWLHPRAKWRLEYNFVQSDTSEDISIKQNVAAYLLHEKYGHGFFYSHTRLGQQLAMLERFRDEPNERYRAYFEIADLIEDSAIIVDEGFAAWVELTFLGQLDREVRQAVYPRRVFLLQDATRLYERQRDSRFFQTFPPRFDSPYQEGFEYLNFASQHFNPCCAVRIFLIATNVEFGILEDTDQHEQIVTEIKWKLLESEEDDARSHRRLRKIGELLYAHREDLQTRLRNRHCPEDCMHGCPLEELVEDRLGWR